MSQLIDGHRAFEQRETSKPLRMAVSSTAGVLRVGSAYGLTTTLYPVASAKRKVAPSREQQEALLASQVSQLPPKLGIE